MNANNLFFHIDYCNSGKVDTGRPSPGKIAIAGKHHKLVYITAGKGEVTIDGKRYDLVEGTLIYTVPEMNRRIEITVEETLSYLSVTFYIAGITFQDSSFCMAADQLPSLPIKMIQHLIDFSSVEVSFEKLVHIWKSKLPGYEFISRTHFEELLIVIIQGRNDLSRNYAAAFKVDKLIRYMREHIDRKLSLEEMAETVQLSAYYLSKIFKEITGYSVVDYFNKIKIDQAKVLLMEGDKKIKDIAHILGFADEFYFSRIFKKIEGISPSQYYNKIVHGI